MGKYFFLRIIKCAVIGIAVLVFFSFVVMSLWNMLIPSLFNGPQLTIFQAGGVLILSKILFGGFGGRGCHCGGGPGGFWREKWKQKFENLSPEEKERLKRKFENYCRKG